MNSRNRKIFATKLLVYLLLVFASAFLTPKASGQTQIQISFEVAFPNLTFNQPDGIFHAPTNGNRLFVMEQAGVVKVLDNNRNVGNSTVFLDIRDRVLYGGEQGLLG